MESLKPTEPESGPAAIYLIQFTQAPCCVCVSVCVCAYESYSVFHSCSFLCLSFFPMNSDKRIYFNQLSWILLQINLLWFQLIHSYCILWSPYTGCLVQWPLVKTIFCLWKMVKQWDYTLLILRSAVLFLWLQIKQTVWQSISLNNWMWFGWWIKWFWVDN